MGETVITNSYNDRCNETKYPLPEIFTTAPDIFPKGIESSDESGS